MVIFLQYNTGLQQFHNYLLLLYFRIDSSFGGILWREGISQKISAYSDSYFHLLGFRRFCRFFFDLVFIWLRVWLGNIRWLRKQNKWDLGAWYIYLWYAGKFPYRCGWQSNDCFFDCFAVLCRAEKAHWAVLSDKKSGIALSINSSILSV